jgi:uncharacterized protein (DUF2252 family)
MSPSVGTVAAKSESPKSRSSNPASRMAAPPQPREAGLSGVFQAGGGVRTRLREVDNPWPMRHRIGKSLRDRTPRESHSDGHPADDRPDPLDLLAASNVGRQEDLVPLRMGRMSASPFTFLRGAACVMAWDLSRSPNSGIRVIIDGDAHINNFGLYGTPQRDVIFDLNDFDEATVGPWEWDLKRLAASVNVAARENGINKAERGAAVRRAVEGYRWCVGRMESMGVLDVWYEHAYPDTKNPLLKRDPKAQALIGKAVAKARTQTNAMLLRKSAERSPSGGLRLREDPPIQTRVDNKTREKVIQGLEEYAAALSPERFFMLNRYHVVDVVHRVVGVGSVGTRAYLALLMGNDDNDPLFLQVKECASPAHAPYVPPLPKQFEHHGKRVVMGQRALQASSDIMLGPTTVDGRPFFVRQMRNMKASIPVEWLTGETFNFYAQACGALLGRAHARSGDAAAIAGYCGRSRTLDKTLATWAEAYGDQTEQDHAHLVQAIKSGKVKAITGL